MRTAHIAAAVVGMIFFVGCSTAYQPRGLAGGYSETQYSTNTFKVRFDGNNSTSVERATDFALLRSADIALQNGAPYFVIVDAIVAEGTITIPATADTTIDATGNNYGGRLHTTGTATTTYTPGYTTTVALPNTSNTIVCYTERPTDAKMVYEAALVDQSLRAKYHLKGLPQAPAPVALAGPAPPTMPSVGSEFPLFNRAHKKTAGPDNGTSGVAAAE